VVGYEAERRVAELKSKHEPKPRILTCPAPQITFTHGNAQALPAHIADNSIDLYTIAFGIRNCTSLPAVLSEAYRVLKPGGRIGVLEFGKVSNPLLKE
jgi:2-methoxy-6-polyprenyl-1,4-benzoquinol methylase